MTYLKIENLTKKFDDYVVLDNVSSSIEKGTNVLMFNFFFCNTAKYPPYTLQTYPRA